MIGVTREHSDTLGYLCEPDLDAASRAFYASALQGLRMEGTALLNQQNNNSNLNNDETSQKNNINNENNGSDGNGPVAGK